MERHIAKRLGVPCAVISAPVHVQDFPARYAPVMGFEGANVLFDTWVHPLVMGLEEHLLTMFRDDFEFNDAAGPSHLGSKGHAPSPQTRQGEPEAVIAVAPAMANQDANDAQSALIWSPEASKELSKIPFFVRGKAKRNTERYASELGLETISIEALYDAKSHFAR
jgi:light-independent protochlorophyllide reductase subunit B